ncbi:hypothetical protein EG329_005416 [Mollisiaceae sp. DMI_Dod_QoI]|nr:hypothetical protein EG329_005416 [Helotiales sp. DMI_Dod_QoI]
MAELSYLEEIIQAPVTCGDSSSNTIELQLWSYILLAILVVFTAVRLGIRIPLIMKERDSKSLPIVIEEALFGTAVLFAIGSIVSISLAGAQGLGKHMCNLGLDSDLVPFVRGIYTAMSTNGMSTDFMTYVNTHLDPLDQSLHDSLVKFLSTFEHTLWLLYFSFLTYTTAISIAKLSTACALVRMFGVNNPLFKKFIVSHGIATILLGVLTMLFGITQCLPVYAAWNITKPRHCINIPEFYVSTAALNIMLDVFLLVVPFIFLRKLQIRPSEKNILMGLFASEVLGVVIGSLRINFLEGLFGLDITYNAVKPLIWTMAQITTCLVCDCIPTLRHLGRAINSLNVRPRSTTAAQNIALENVGNRNHGSVRSSTQTVVSLFEQYRADLQDEGGPPSRNQVMLYARSDIGSTPSIGGSAVSETDVV